MIELNIDPVGHILLRGEGVNQMRGGGGGGSKAITCLFMTQIRAWTSSTDKGFMVVEGT